MKKNNMNFPSQQDQMWEKFVKGMAYTTAFVALVLIVMGLFLV